MQKWIVLGILGLAAAISVGVAVATVKFTVLADTNKVRENIFRIEFVPSADEPRFSSGWHTHPGPVFVQVQRGRVKISSGPPGGPCHTAIVRSGQTYIETPEVPVLLEANRKAKWTTTLILPDSEPGDPILHFVSDPCPDD
jgi:quercetin dioxygenase-like cupin family protein